MKDPPGYGPSWLVNHMAVFTLGSKQGATQGSLKYRPQAASSHPHPSETQDQHLIELLTTKSKDQQAADVL